MGKADIIIRAENPSEAGTSTEIIKESFGRDQEVRILSTLRDTAEFRKDLSIVADNQEGGLLGYALYYPVTVQGPQTIKGVNLFPMGVRPAAQRQGVGERLVRHGLERCRSAGFNLVFAIGRPQFLGRFGFQPARALGYESDLKVADNVFLTFDLSGEHHGKITGKVLFPQVFSG